VVIAGLPTSSDFILQTQNHHRRIRNRQSFHALTWKHISQEFAISYVRTYNYPKSFLRASPQRWLEDFPVGAVHPEPPLLDPALRLLARHHSQLDHPLAPS
jgi:hypothetical protein